MKEVFSHISVVNNIMMRQQTNKKNLFIWLAGSIFIFLIIGSYGRFIIFFYSFWWLCINFSCYLSFLNKWSDIVKLIGLKWMVWMMMIRNDPTGYRCCCFGPNLNYMIPVFGYDFISIHLFLYSLRIWSWKVENFSILKSKPGMRLSGWNPMNANMG